MQDVLDAVVEPRRREILRLLSSVELAAGAIAAHFPDVSRPAVSQHVRVLKDAGLVSERRDGTRRLYRIRVEGFRDLQAYFEQFWDSRLETAARRSGARTKEQAWCPAQPRLTRSSARSASTRLRRRCSSSSPIPPSSRGGWRWRRRSIRVRAGCATRCTTVARSTTADPYYMRGEFVEVAPPDRVVFTWGFTNADVGVPPGSSTVEVTLTRDGSGTLLRLVHRGLPESELASHSGGWTGMLERLTQAVMTLSEEQR